MEVAASTQPATVNIRLRLCAFRAAALGFLNGPSCWFFLLFTFFATKLLFARLPWHTPVVETDNPTLCDPLPRQAPCGLPACQQLLRDARQQIGFYKALHQRAVQREAKLKEQLAHGQTECDARLAQRDREHQQHTAELEAEVRLLKQPLYGRRSEAHHVPNTLAGDAPAPDDAPNHAAAAPRPAPRPPAPP